MPFEWHGQPYRYMILFMKGEFEHLVELYAYGWRPGWDVEVLLSFSLYGAARDVSVYVVISIHLEGSGPQGYVNKCIMQTIAWISLS